MAKIFFGKYTAPTASIFALVLMSTTPNVNAQSSASAADVAAVATAAAASAAKNAADARARANAADETAAIADDVALSKAIEERAAKRAAAKEAASAPSAGKQAGGKAAPPPNATASAPKAGATGSTSQSDKTPEVADGQRSFEGLNFGIGLALFFPFDKERGGVTEAEVDGNNFIRVTKNTNRVPRLMLESHYLFKLKNDAKWYCPTDNKCSHGPFVAIEAGSSGSSTISAYGLGWMLGFKKNSKEGDVSSWNIGVGYAVRSGVRVLGDGLYPDQPLPANDKIRYKEISQSGWMWFNSFTF